MISEAEAGQVLEVDASGNIVWETINKYHDTHAALITEDSLSRRILRRADWSCPAAAGE